MKLLSLIKEYRRWRKLKKGFEKDSADSNQAPWLDENENEIPGWVGHMFSEVEPKFIWYYTHFMENSKEDLAKRCAWNEIKKEKKEIKLPTIIHV